MPAENPDFLTSPPDLGRRERTLFELLARDPGRVFTKDEVGRLRPSLRDVRVLDSTAARLGQALREWDGRRSPVNVWGVGYRLRDPQ